MAQRKLYRIDDDGHDGSFVAGISAAVGAEVLVVIVLLGAMACYGNTISAVIERWFQ